MGQQPHGILYPTSKNSARERPRVCLMAPIRERNNNEADMTHSSGARRLHSPVWWSVVGTFGTCILFLCTAFTQTLPSSSTTTERNQPAGARQAEPQVANPFATPWLLNVQTAARSDVEVKPEAV